MNYDIISSEKAPKAVGTYSQGVDLGELILYSGQIGISPETGEMASDFEGQMTQILKNIDGLLEHSNLTRRNICKTTVFLKDLSQFDIVNQHYVKYFETPYPARSCVEVSRLPKDALVEIEVIAIK
ncbi:MAG: Rid family detoxifying hydrolase [Bacteriovoracaceae bacterium]